MQMRKPAAIVLAAILGAQGVSAVAALPPPYKDGCSGGMSAFYRNVLGRVPVWEGCCDFHDKAYQNGGTFTDKAWADAALRDCVAATGHPLEGWTMWAAVQIGGQPFFPTGWRWGFGRDYAVSWWYDRDRPLFFFEGNARDPRCDGPSRYEAMREGSPHAYGHACSEEQR